MSPSEKPTTDGQSSDVSNQPAINNSPIEEARRKSAIDAIIDPRKDEGVTIQQMEEAPKFTSADELPSPEEIIEALGIPDWKKLEKKLVRRLDFTLVPMLWILYVTNYLDRASLGQARISEPSIDTSLSLTGYQFSNAISILSAGYVLGQLPSNMLIPYIRPSLYLGGCAFVWSGVAAAVAGVKSYEGLLAVRFFLGVVEAPLFPGAVYHLSCWYTRRELGVRMAMMATGVPIANGMSGLIAAAVFSNLEGKAGVLGWQWLFIVLAICGGVFGVMAVLILPDYPASRTGSTMWTMTEDMRRIAETRIIADRVTLASSAEIKTSIWQGLKMSLRDYKLWIIILINITISAAYGFSNFYPAIVRGFGYSRVITLVITFPPYFCAAIAAVSIAWSSDRLQDRGWHFSIPVAFAMVGYVVCMATQNGIARYVVSYIYVVGLFGANPLIQTWISGTLSKSPEQKATSIAINNILGQAGNVIAPYFFIAEDEPRYLMAFILMFVMAGLCIAGAMLLKWCLWRINKKLLRYALEHGTPYNPYLQ
jgi:MFS family permease